MLSRRNARTLAFTGSLLAAALAPASSLLAQTPAELVPEGAHIAVIVPGLDQIEEKMARVEDALPMVPLDDLYEGIDAMRELVGPAYQGDQPAVIVIPSVVTFPMSAQMGQPAMVILAPVKDYTQFVERMGGSAVEEIAEIQPPDSPPMFAKQFGDYAAISPNKRALQSYEPGGNDSPLDGQLTGSLDEMVTGDSACFYVNFEDLGPAVLPMFEMGAEGVIAQAEMQLSMSDLDDEVIDAQIGNLRVGIAMVSTILRDGKALLLGLDFSDDAVAFDFGFQMRSGSTMAGYFPGGGDLDGAIGKMPNRPVMVASTFDNRAIRVGDMLKAMLEIAPEMETLMVGHEHWMPIYDSMKRYSYSVYAPGNEATGGFLQAVARIETDDADAMKQNVLDTFEAMDGYEVPTMPEGQMMSYTTSQRTNAGEVEGVSYDQFSITMEMPPALVEQMGPMAGFLTMMANQSGFLAADNDAVITTTVPDEALLGEAIRASRDGSDDPELFVNARSNALPDNLAFEAFVSVQGIGAAANNFSAMTGAQPIVVPADLPPISMGLGVDDDAMHYRAHIPFETVIYLSTEAQGMMNDVMGGMPDEQELMPQGDTPRAPF
ncbi:hypothetical protein [Mucisphaera calidilacus]|uniref:DUF3352 domain-containing protein n=1 Tax=Mucisphaera calidilacus TaxID=2527982 RepID=A0A518BZI4_9BACT|nr:hypothetical protein [Mucisphaera calidilacus]QDU72380.1 hypothetical protein Pan265_22450 [Mucisphaera calidilacus]